MGGRSATSGIQTFGRKMGTRLTPKQYKDAVSDEANFIFRELEQQPALQKIIRKSFKGNTAQVTFEFSSLEVKHSHSFTEALTNITNDLTTRLKQEKGKKKQVNTWSAYDVARAKEQAIQQALDELEKLKKRKK